MHSSARRHPLFAGFLLVVFLTVQLAAAAYACAGSRYQVTDDGNAEAALTESCAEMAGMDQMARMSASADGEQAGDQSALCLAHCQADSKSADHVSPQLPVFLPVLLNVIVPTPVMVADSRVVLHADAAARAPPPALNILHCRSQT
ncbi:hypothetical protein [Cupriavidus sp. WS]|uniref:hypothetical protein n=1 Tax=Cupriavidus sp. WS TaxID=1312922 RepID=UPI00037F4898|nr:hypothetical protein [Cupriavidus sp. WS]